MNKIKYPYYEILFNNSNKKVTSRRVENDNNKDYKYYGEFVTFSDGSYRHYQTWTGKGFRESESYKRNTSCYPFFWRDPEATSETWTHGGFLGREIHRETIIDKETAEYNDANTMRKLRDESKLYQNNTVLNILDGLGNDLHHPVEDKKGWENTKEALEWINTKLRCEEDNNNRSDLRKENQELRQQLTTVKQELAEVLKELKNLKKNSVGQDNEKLTQQIFQNEKLIESGNNVSEVEVKEQINKSQSLIKEVNINVSATKSKENSNSSFPYVVSGSVILVFTGIIIYFCWKRVRKNKVA